MEELEKTIKNGVAKGIGTFWLVFASALLASILGVDYFRPYDDTDDGKERSGLIICIDSKTGCEYLTTKHGGLTPRMNQSGTYQICTTPVRKVN